MEITQASYHLLFWNVAERNGQCEHRPLWRNKDGMVAERKLDACVNQPFYD
jgi:hypothetical protein